MMYNPRIETYRDFVLRLIYYIEKFYLDKKTLYENEDIENHFTFCFDKTCEDFLKEDFDFIDNGELYEYLFGYFIENEYKSDYEQTITTDKNFNSHREFWITVFTPRQNKNNPNKDFMVILTEIYQIFDLSMVNEEIIIKK